MIGKLVGEVVIENELSISLMDIIPFAENWNSKNIEARVSV